MQPACVCAVVARLARPALVHSCGAHTVCVCRAQAFDVVQRRVQSGGLGLWGAAGEGWDGQGSQVACANVGVSDADCQTQLCAACAVRPV